MGIAFSLVLGVLYGVMTIAETQFLKKMRAIDKDGDSDQETSKKKHKVIFFRTVTACIGFTLAILNIGIEAFVVHTV